MAYIGKINNPNDLEKAIDRVLCQLKRVILKFNYKKASTLLFWLNDWSERYLPIEDKFNYNSLKYYERGSIIEANFGFKIGSEQGGLHYAIVLENNNDKSNKTIMVIPLGSLDPGQSLSNLDKHEIFLGYDLFQEEIQELEKEIKIRKNEILKLKTEGNDISAFQKKLDKSIKKLEKYKLGTVAFVNQICALSKLRIYSPKYEKDELSSLRLNPEKLTDIDNAIKKYFLKNDQSVLPIADLENIIEIEKDKEKLTP